MKFRNVTLSTGLASEEDISSLSNSLSAIKYSVPLLDLDRISQLTSEGYAIPSAYIQIPNVDADSDALLASKCTGSEVVKQYYSAPDKPSFTKKAFSVEAESDSIDKSYINIVFSSIRSLQSEVAKLRNTMEYGMYSYTDDKTAMATVESEYLMAEHEPLWAIEEGDLAVIDDVEVLINSRHCLKPSENVVASDGMLSVKVGKYAEWTDDTVMPGCCKNVSDAKLFLYLTTSTLNTKIKIKNLNDASSKEITVDLSKIEMAPTVQEKYNVLFVVSRAYLNTEDLRYYGLNFIWITVADYTDLNVKKEGYWNQYDQKLHDDVLIIDIEDDIPSKYKIEEHRYYIDSVRFESELKIYKFNMYSKYQDFSTYVEPRTPSDSTYKYEVAHITIRAVDNINVIDKIIKQLPKNELIYNRADSSLYIVNDTNTYKKISSGGGSGGGMLESEIRQWLALNGIKLTTDASATIAYKPITISNLASITLINLNTGSKFLFTCTEDGLLKGTKLTPEDEMLSNRIIYSGYDVYDEAKRNIRGFVGNLRGAEGSISKTAFTKNIKLASDRIKIASIYAPNPALSASYGCSHAFIELENTSDVDFSLDGCYLHVGRQHLNGASVEGETDVHTLALEGILPANGTYLIRGKRYTNSDSPNCFIDVTEYDKEWYISSENPSTYEIENNLIDLSIDNRNTYLLTYGMPDDFSWKKHMTSARDIADTDYSTIKYRFDKTFIDVVSIGAHIEDAVVGGKASWGSDMSLVFAKKKFDCIYKNVFELDPAMQAYQALYPKDSSRTRNNKTTDYQYLDLTNDRIEFPKTDDIFDVKNYTPKASYLKKNVSTDKSKLDFNKPNMTTCSFGININKTRCFNWVSVGRFNEYIWIRPKNDTTGWSRFESYKSSAEDVKFADVSKFGITKKVFSDNIKEKVYNRISHVFPGCGTSCTIHKCIVDLNLVSSPTTYEYIVGRSDKNGNPDANHTSDIQTFTLYPVSYNPRLFLITDLQGFHWIEYQAWAAAALELLNNINEKQASENIIPVLINTGDMTQNGTRINEWLDYYNAGKCLFNHIEQMNVVGNNDLCDTNPYILGTGDDIGKSNGYYFHLFYCYEIPSGLANQPSFTPIYNNKYIPSLYYFETDSTSSIKFRILMINSELTVETCKSWFNANSNNRVINIYTGWEIKNSNDDVVIPLHYDNTNVHIYEMIYNILLNGKDLGYEQIAVCHEMPFTVITNDNIAKTMEDSILPETKLNDLIDIDRSISFAAATNTTSLVGSHLNRISVLDGKSNIWFSRLLEYFNIKLCIGGHKHTYACTYPVKELYKYSVKIGENTYISSSIDGAMPMPPTLENDTIMHTDISVINDGKTYGALEYRYVLASELEAATAPRVFKVDTSKFPLIESKYRKVTDNGIFVKSSTAVYPYYTYTNSTLTYDGVVYFMLLATGYKLTSNKELPSSLQDFAYVLPETTRQGTSDKPSDNQQYPMYAEIIVNSNKMTIYLNRIENILLDNGYIDESGKRVDKHTFSLQNYGTASCVTKYMKQTYELAKNQNKYGEWTTVRVPTMEINF